MDVLPNREAEAWRGLLASEFVDGWPRWTSFACIWLWTCLVGKSGLTDAALAQFDGMFRAPCTFVLFAVVAALAVVVCASGKGASGKDTSVVGSRAALVVAGIALTGGAVGVDIASVTGGAGAFVAGSCLGGVAIGLLKIAWGEMFSRMSLRSGLVDMGYSLIASTSVFLILLAAPQAVRMFALVACAIPCPWLVLVGTRRLGEHPAPPPPPGAAKAITFNWSLLILPALVGMTSGLMTGVMGVRQEAGVEYARVGMAAAELLAGVFLLFASRRLSDRFGASHIYAAALVPIVAGIALTSANTVPVWMSATVNELGFAAFYFFMIVYWGDLARRVDWPVVRMYALGYLVFQASQIPGLILAGLAAHPSGSLLFAFLPVALILAFFVVVLLVFNDYRSPLRQWLTAGEPAETGDEIPEACVELTRRFSLTPREHEVLSLLARGRTAAYIGRSLGIAPDTAKTHIRSIYRKMDVHTQQELIEQIDAVVVGAGRGLVH